MTQRFRCLVFVFFVLRISVISISYQGCVSVLGSTHRDVVHHDWIPYSL